MNTEQQQRENKKAKYRFNLRKLEDDALRAYAALEKSPNEHTRTQIFLKIKDLAFAIVSVGPYDKYNLDYENVSYEYAVYLFERIVIGSFKMVGYKDRFPLQHYIRKNIKHVIFSNKDSGSWREVVSDLEFLMNVDEITDYSESIFAKISAQDKCLDRNVYAAKLIDFLRMFYSYEEIRRLLPISLEHLYGNWYLYFSNKVPEDIQDFVIVLIAASKRIVRIENVFYGTDIKKSTLKRALHSAVRSTVFLSTIVDTKVIPKEFLLALDMDSLYRLVSVLGGRTIKVPTIRELDTLIGGVVAASKVILEGKEVKNTLKNTRKDFDLNFSSHVDVQFFVSKAVENFNLFKNESHSEPLINLLASSISSIDRLFNKDAIKLTENSTELMKQYCELSKAVSTITESLLKISTHAEEKNFEEEEEVDNKTNNEGETDEIDSI